MDYLVFIAWPSLIVCQYWSLLHHLVTHFATVGVMILCTIVKAPNTIDYYTPELLEVLRKVLGLRKIGLASLLTV